MKILVTAHSIAPSTGGARVGILGICRGLSQRGHKVVLIVTNADGSGREDVSIGVPIDYYGVEIFYYPAQVISFGNVFSYPLISALKKYISQSDIVMIHSLYQFTSTVTAHYCRKYKVPYVLRPHGTLDPFLVYRRRWFLKWAYIKLFENKNFNRAASIQYSSLMEQEMTKDFIDVTSPSIIIPEGIQLSNYSNLPSRGTFRTKYPKMSDKIIILFLGRFHQKKGLELLIKAFIQVASRRTDIHLVLAGAGDHEYTERIKKTLEKSGLSHQATLTGLLDDEMKYAVLSDSDIFVLPSYGENFGIAVVEAMAAGLPVLISDKVGIWKEIVEAEAGLVTPCESEEIALALEKLIDDPSLRFKLGQQGKKLAESQFSMDGMAERMENAFQAICNGQK